MKQLLGFFAVAVLAACSSGSGNNGVTPPPTKTFSFGNATPVVAGSGSQADTAATAAQTDTGQIVTAATTSGSTASASSAPELAITLTSDALPAAKAPTPVPHLSSAELVSALRAGSRGGNLASGCYTETANSLTYNNCDCSSGTTGYTCNINGSLTASNNEVKWNITINIHYSGSGSTVIEAGTLSGDITVVPTTSGGTINGFAKEGISATATGNGNSEYFAYTAEVDFKSLVYDNTCGGGYGGFTSGQLEVARTVASSGNYTPPYSDAAVLFTWTACGTVTVATGT